MHQIEPKQAKWNNVETIGNTYNQTQATPNQIEPPRSKNNNIETHRPKQNQIEPNGTT